MHHIEKGWQSYKLMYNNNQDARQAFMAGAGFLFYFIMIQLDDGTSITESDLHILKNLHEEIDAFSFKLDEKLFR